MSRNGVYSDFLNPDEHHTFDKNKGFVAAN